MSGTRAAAGPAHRLHSRGRLQARWLRGGGGHTVRTRQHAPPQRPQSARPPPRRAAPSPRARAPPAARAPLGAGRPQPRAPAEVRGEHGRKDCKKARPSPPARVGACGACSGNSRNIHVSRLDQQAVRALTSSQSAARAASSSSSISASRSASAASSAATSNSATAYCASTCRRIKITPRFISFTSGEAGMAHRARPLGWATSNTAKLREASRKLPAALRHATCRLAFAPAP